MGAGVDASPGGTTINFPGPPAREDRVTTHGLEYGTLAPAQQQNIADSNDLLRQQLETAERERQQQTKYDAIDRQHKDEAAAAQQAIDDEKARRDAIAQKDIGQWQDRLEGAYKKAQSAPAPSLFADATTGQKALRGFGLLLAGLGDVVNAGAANRYGTARSDAFGQIVEADLQRQREKIAKLKDDEVRARTGFKDAVDGRNMMMAELDAKGAGFAKRLEAMAAARMAASKEGEAGFINAQKAGQAAQEMRLKFQQQSLAPLTIKHQGPTTEITTRDAKPPDAKDAKDIVMGDPLNPAEAGKVLGQVTSGRGGAQAFSQNDTGLTTAIDALKALHADIQKNGERPTSAEALKRRDSLNKNASLQVAANSSAGLNVPAFEAETGSIGVSHNPVVQWIIGANPKAIEAKIHELENKQVRNRGQGLLPMSPTAAAAMDARQGGAPAPLVPAGPPAPAGSVPPAPPSTAPPSIRERAIAKLKANPNLPGAKAVRQTYNITDEDLR